MDMLLQNTTLYPSVAQTTTNILTIFSKKAGKKQDITVDMNPKLIADIITDKLIDILKKELIKESEL